MRPYCHDALHQIWFINRSGICGDVFVKMRDLGMGPVYPFQGRYGHEEHNLRLGHGPDVSFGLDMSGSF